MVAWLGLRRSSKDEGNPASSPTSTANFEGRQETRESIDPEIDAEGEPLKIPTTGIKRPSVSSLTERILRRPSSQVVPGRPSRRSSQSSLSSGGSCGADFVLPDTYRDYRIAAIFTMHDFPTAEALAEVLGRHGLDTSRWGEGNSKTVAKLWKELEGGEAGLELWAGPDGSSMPVRVTHVLRAKVTSRENARHGVFLFNTWQQFGDGRKRTRNGLLSEKLSTAEIPLQDHLHEVCVRAVTEEEMAQVVDSSMEINQRTAAPVYDKAYRCPLEVEDEEFVEHTVEMEESKSFPGMVTMYHLYTVDIFCKGLPNSDFNTLEWNHPDKDGNRKLKYIHAWVWLEWSMIQRYLFEGSTLKDRKSKGDFQDPKALEKWLRQFNVAVDQWGTGRWKTISSLWDELESNEACLEHWNRQDGAALLLRVVHVMQLSVSADEARKSGRFLFNLWKQPLGTDRVFVYREMSHVLNQKAAPYNQATFETAVSEAIQRQLTYLADTIHVALMGRETFDRDAVSISNVKIGSVEFKNHRFDLTESQSYKSVLTAYHLFTVNVAATGLPEKDFATVAFNPRASSPSQQVIAYGWRWVTWQQSLDMMHHRVAAVNEQASAAVERVRGEAAMNRLCLQDLRAAIDRVVAQAPGEDASEALLLCRRLQDQMSVPDLGVPDGKCTKPTSVLAMVPPSVVDQFEVRESQLLDKVLEP